MKRILFLISILLMSIQGGKEVIQKEVNLTSIPTNVIKTLSETETLAIEDIPMTDPLSAMSPAINALVMAMVEQDLVYDSTDPTFFWTAVFYTIGINETADFRVIDQGDSLWIPQEMVQDTVFALFGLNTTLPSIPNSMEHLVSYDKELYGYHWAYGDASLTECQFQEPTPLGNGVYEITGEFVSLPDDQSICSFTCTLIETDSIFAYYIQDIVL